MLTGGRIQAVIEIIEAVITQRIPADRACSFYFRNNKFVGSSDRRFIGDMVFDVFRLWAKLLWGLSDNQDSSVRLGVFLYGLLKKVWTFDQLKHILQEAQKFIEPFSEDETDALSSALKKLADPLPSWVQYGYPQWLESYLQESLGIHFASEVQTFTQQAPMTIRVNTLKAMRESVLQQLLRDGIVAHPTSLSPWGIIFEERFKLDDHELYKQGFVEVQDEASQLFCQFTDVKPGEQVLDYCAGAGGKTLAMATMMENKGVIVATDIHGYRLKDNTLRLRRNGVFNTQCRLLDEKGHQWLNRQKARFDKVVVDAPCSGSGTWRRNPDMKWKLTPEDMSEIGKKQQEILEQASHFVKPGGVLIYSTCSFFKQENQDQVELFLKNHPEFTIGDTLQLFSSVQGTDGFFGVRMGRVIQE